MTKAKAVSPAPRSRPKRTPAAPKREPVVRAVDEVVEAVIDDMVDQMTESPQAYPGAPLVVDAGKQKLVRDSFTMPKNEYQTLDMLKTRLLGLSHAAKKSELLRAGVAALGRMSDPQLLAAIAVVPNLKTGRPKGGKPGSGSSKKKG